MIKIIPLFLSDGVGGRIWLLFSEHFPRQSLPLADREYSLLRWAAFRIQGFS
jgi:mannose-1-phosphate guanylyltransferase